MYLRTSLTMKVLGQGSPPVFDFYNFFELSVDRVSGLLFKVVTKFVCRVCGIISVSCSKNSLVSSSEFLI